MIQFQTLPRTEATYLISLVSGMSLAYALMIVKGMEKKGVFMVREVTSPEPPR